MGGGSDKKQGGKLDKLDKVYNEMKQKNKYLKRQLHDQKAENETLKQVMVEFKQQFQQGGKD